MPKISALPAATQFLGPETFPVDQGGTTKKGLLSGLPAVPATVTQEAAGTHPFVLADAGTYIQFTAAGGCTATIPLNATVAFPIGTLITIEQDGAAQVTVAITATGTLNSAGAAVKTASQYSVAYLRKVAADTWTLFGSIA